MRHVVTVDFGSTFTKIVVIDIVQKRILLSDKVVSSVNTDASIGLKKCYEIAKTIISEDEFEKAVKLASSSAAGGLRMSVVGLTKSLSTLAGKSAALGAGAKIVGNFCGLLSDDLVSEIEESDTEIILLCGGYEHGNTSIVLKNAKMLAQSMINVPIIYSGNSDLVKEIRRIMRIGKKQCFIIDNIMPSLGNLNVKPAQNIIRNLFLKHITDMKGFNVVKEEFQNSLVPTPAAVLAAGELLIKGTTCNEGFGPALIVDIGGATTDVYSFNYNKSYQGSKIVGIEEPFGKRTVEGDLGMRESSCGVLNGTQLSTVLEDLEITEDHFRNSIKNRTQFINFLPKNEIEIKIDNAIAKLAVYEATKRHAGKITPSYNKKCQKIQTGKNLTEITKVIGTGGVLVHNRNPADILQSVRKNHNDESALMPEKIETFLDTEYVLFSAGLLKEINEEVAFEIMKKSIRQF